jgi:hypothetical protein
VAPRFLATLLLVGSLLAGGCATRSVETARWPVAPRIRLGASRATVGGQAAPGLTDRELRSLLAEAGVPSVWMTDDRYVRIEHAALPALLDWYEAMTAVYGFTPESLDQDGFQRDRAVRILRVFTTMRLGRQAEPMAAASAIGMVRVNLLQSWGDFSAGETHDLLAVATERGVFLVDPVGRGICPLEYDPFYWRFEEARF